jgi:hypothetical protein
MATVAKAGTPSLSSIIDPSEAQAYQVGSGLKAGEDIAAGDVVYIASTGRFMKSNGTAATAPAKVRGIALGAATSGEALTVYRGVEVRYGSGMTPGAQLFASATAGLLDDAATTGGTAAVGYVVDATRIFIHGSFY